MVARLPEVRERLVKAGLWEEFERLYFGYAEMTPSGGLHILYQLADSSVDGNTKIAMNGDNEVTIETRGEGGFVVVAPSNGPTHRTNQPWIARRSGASRRSPRSTSPGAGRHRGPAVVVRRDAASAAAHRAHPPGLHGHRLGRRAGEPPGPGRRDARQRVDLRAGRPEGQLWRRPGKDFGVSGRINKTGRLHVFTTSTELPAGRTTYDAVDVALARSLGRPPSSDERVGYLKTPAPPR